MQQITNIGANDIGRLSYEVSFFGGFQSKMALPPSVFGVFPIHVLHTPGRDNK
jgi:hypothetical protein